MKGKKKIILALFFVPIALAVALTSRTSARNHRIEDLEYALSNEDTHVRLGAVVELIDYGSAAVPSLKKALRDSDPNVKLGVMKALAKIGGQQAADALAVTLSDRIRTRGMGIYSIAATGKAALPYLYKALETEPFPRERMFAAHGIARLVEPGFAPEIMKRFEGQPIATKMHLIIALVKVDDDEAYASLKRLSKSPDPLVRFYVASTIAEEALGKRGLPILMDAVDDEAWEVRIWAMFGLAKLNRPESYPVVLAALDDEDCYVRKEAAYTLGNLGNRAAVPHLISCLGDSHYLVRGDAAESLGKLGDPQAVSMLKPLLDEESELVQIKAAEALARLSDYGGIENLIAMLDSPVYVYRFQACLALRSISNEEFADNPQQWARWWEQAKKKVEAEGPDRKRN